MASGMPPRLLAWRQWVQILQTDRPPDFDDLVLACLEETPPLALDLTALERFGRSLPLPLRCLPVRPEPTNPDHAIWFEWLGWLGKQLRVDDAAALARLTMLPEDMSAVSRQLAAAPPCETADLVRRLDDLIARQRSLNVDPGPAGMTLPPRGRLPELAFPVVIGQGDRPLVLFETVLAGADAALKSPWSAMADQAFTDGIGAARAEIRRRYGETADLGVCCLAREWLGLTIEGGSGSLAVWTALWLAANRMSVPGGALALTGDIDEHGRVGEVGDIELKVRVALAAGYPRIVVPSVELRAAPSWMRRDRRIVGIEDCEQLAGWLLLTDPLVADRNRLFHVARGLIRSAAMPGPAAVRRMVGEDLAAGRWSDAWRNLRRVCRESDRRGRTARARRLVASVRAAFAPALEENQHRRLPRRLWYGLFRALVPESVRLLHLPLLLERFGGGERPLADAIYAQLGLRLADQDLDLALALAWGRRLFADPQASPWFDRGFRERYPMLCWFLFADPLVALHHLLAWPDRLPSEERWRRSIFAGLARFPSSLARPRAAGAGRFARILARAVARDLPDFRADLTSVTPIDRRPALIVGLLARYDTHLDEMERRCLRRLFMAHLRVRCLAESDVRRFAALCDWSRLDPSARQKLTIATRQSRLEMLERCASELQGGPARVGVAARLRSRPSSWPELLHQAWSLRRNPATGNPQRLSSDDEMTRRQQVRALDAHLTDALSAIVTGRPIDGDAMAFRCLANPALALADLLLSSRRGVDAASAPSRAWGGWFALLSEESWPAGLLLRTNMARAWLCHVAGRWFARGWVPPDAVPCSMRSSLPFLSGACGEESPGRDQPARVDQQLKRRAVAAVVTAFRRGNLENLVWLPYVRRHLTRADRTTVAKALADHAARVMSGFRPGDGESPGAGAGTDVAGAAVDRGDGAMSREVSVSGLVLLMSRFAWPGWRWWAACDRPGAAWRPACRRRLKEFRRAPAVARTEEQAFLPLAMLWHSDGRFSWTIARRLAGTRGFSPLALGATLSFSSAGSCHLGRVARFIAAGRFWPIEWERIQMQTILLLEAWHRADRRLLSRRLLADDLDLPNAMLCERLLRQLSATSRFRHARV